MKCPEEYKTCKHFKEENPEESQCETESTVGFCVKKINKNKDYSDPNNF